MCAKLKIGLFEELMPFEGSEHKSFFWSGVPSAIELRGGVEMKLERNFSIFPTVTVMSQLREQYQNTIEAEILDLGCIYNLDMYEGLKLVFDTIQVIYKVYGIKSIQLFSFCVLARPR